MIEPMHYKKEVIQEDRIFIASSKKLVKCKETTINRK
jgi:hypothetical protein